MSKTRVLSSILVAAGLAVSVAAVPAIAAAAPAIVNGGFEDPAEAPDSLTEITYTGIPGWTGDSIGGAAHEYIINGNIQDTYGRDYGTTPFGDQYLGLNAIANNSFHSIESQTVGGFTIGDTYALTVYFANLDGSPDPDLSVVATKGATGSGAILAQGVYATPVEGPYGSGTIDFVPVTLDFTAKSASTTFSIGNDSYTGVLGVDNVSLAELSPGAAPEPSTWALMIAGMGMAGAALRFGRRAGRPVQRRFQGGLAVWSAFP